jgi:hypothetical protein
VAQGSGCKSENGGSALPFAYALLCWTAPSSPILFAQCLLLLLRLRLLLRLLLLLLLLLFNSAPQPAKQPEPEPEEEEEERPPSRGLFSFGSKKVGAGLNSH